MLKTSSAKINRAHVSFPAVKFDNCHEEMGEKKRKYKITYSLSLINCNDDEGYNTTLMAPNKSSHSSVRNIYEDICKLVILTEQTYLPYLYKSPLLKPRASFFLATLYWFIGKIEPFIFSNAQKNHSSPNHIRSVCQVHKSLT